MLLRIHFIGLRTSNIIWNFEKIFWKLQIYFWKFQIFFCNLQNILRYGNATNWIRRSHTNGLRQHVVRAMKDRKKMTRQKKDDKTEKWQEKRDTRRKWSHRLVNLIVRPQSHAQLWGRFLLFLSLFPCNDKIFNYQLSIVNYNSYLCTQYYI